MKFYRVPLDANDSSSLLPYYEDFFQRPPIVLHANFTPEEADCRTKKLVTDETLTKYIFLFGYTLLFLCSLSGNLLVVWFVIQYRHLQTTMNLFVANLAVSDLLVCFTGLWVCTCLPFFQGTSIFVSSLTLMAIAVDRYVVICHRSNSVATVSQDHMSMRTCILIISLIWVVSLVLVMPYAIHMRLAYVRKPCNYFLCIEVWKSNSLRQYYGIGVLLLQFVLPFSIIGLSYTRIWSFLNDRRSLVTERESIFEIQRKRKLLRLLVAMVVLFAVCLFPINVLNLLRDLGFHTFLKEYFSFLFLLFHMMSMIVTASNPLLYAWMNQSFRQEFFFTFPFLAKICGQEDLLNMELPYCATHSRSRSNYNRSRRCNAARLLQASQTIDRSAVKSRRISCSNQELTYLGKLSHCGDDNERELEPTRRARSKTVTTVTSNGNGGRLSHSMVDPPTSTTPIQLFPTPSVSPRQSFEAEVFLDDNTAYSESVHV